MITCLWNNDLFAKKSPRAKFAIAALRMFELQCGNILFFLENKKSKYRKNRSGKFDWCTQAAFQLHDIFNLKGSVYVFEGILDYKNFERLYSFNVIPSHPREW